MKLTAPIINCFSLLLVAGRPIPSVHDVATTTAAVGTTVGTSKPASPPLKVAIASRKPLNILSKRMHPGEEHAITRPSCSTAHVTHANAPGEYPEPPYLKWNLDEPVTKDFHEAGAKGGRDVAFWNHRIRTALIDVDCYHVRSDVRMFRPFRRLDHYHAIVDVNPRLRGSRTLHVWETEEPTQGPVSRVLPKITDARGVWELSKWALSNFYKPHLRIMTVPSKYRYGRQVEGQDNAHLLQNDEQEGGAGA